MNTEPFTLNYFLSRFQLLSPFPAQSPAPYGRHAAVLVPVIDCPRPTLLLTRRAITLRQHPGQIAFPGGVVEHHDHYPIDTALRETQEEIGIPTHKVRIIGTLPAVTSRTGFRVTPVVGVIPPGLVYRCSSAEVEAVFEIPLQDAFAIPRYTAVHFYQQGKFRRVWFSTYKEHLIWGMTAEIIRQLGLQLAGDSVEK